MKGPGRAGHRHAPILSSPFSPATPGLNAPPAISPPPPRRSSTRGKASAASSGKGDGDSAPASSARKLAAGIWRRQDRIERFSPSAVHGHPRSPCVCKLKNSHLHGNPIPSLGGGLCSKHELTNFAMERATRWDPGIPESELTRLLDHLNLAPDEQPHGRLTSTAADLRDELYQARALVANLEAECELWRKKLGHLHGKALRRRREEEKLAAMAAGLEGELRRERKDRRWLEVVNIKLAGEVAAAEASVWRRQEDYEEEKKERELMEEVCRELAEKADDGRAEIEALKRETMEIRGELDWERKMLQVAETWREERVQMKLVDAKLAIEEKHSQVSKLRPMLQKFLQGEEVVSVAEEEDDDRGDEDDGDSSWEEMLSRSEELDSSIPSIGTEGEVMAER